MDCFKDLFPEEASEPKAPPAKPPAPTAEIELYKVDVEGKTVSTRAKLREKAFDLHACVGKKDGPQGEAWRLTRIDEAAGQVI